MQIKNFILTSKLIILAIAFVFANCLPYVKDYKLESEKEIGRSPEYESDIVIEQSLVYNVLEFTVNETAKNYSQIKKEQEFKVGNKLDFSQPVCSGDGMVASNSNKHSYWRCMFGWTHLSYGLGYLISIPLFLYDWITYPIYASLSSNEIRKVEERKLDSTENVKTPEGILKFTQTYPKKIEKAISFKNGKAEVRLSEEERFQLWKGDYQFQYSFQGPSQVRKYNVTYPKPKPYEWDKSFVEKAKLKLKAEGVAEYNRCAGRFTISAIHESYRYFPFLMEEDKYSANLLFKNVCGKYSGTSAEGDCLKDFYSCSKSVREYEEENIKYEK
ncbi:hypothetical protein LEP1GSC050_4105 [Leptospira broomii serovar Hurstbridge str. 5399]|uniref:Uncharacterized protein n=1 Tax=Leptospira broomii serovar Hurstbridge str. 5399 TaxID=1049789 RepID=T0F074_9LEPT|nr:hypothetical protein [Leptospira broomii]EQA44545.1 hypothetical protein LEP1GSC050_4105 [Leptospira broomii serovar Hurstbridge str. 5399]